LTEDSILGKGKRPDMDEDNEKLDEMSEEESFAELLGASLINPVQFNAGQRVGKDS